MFSHFVSCWDVVGEHFDKFTGEERDHPLLIETVMGDGVLTLSGSMFDPLVESRLSGWVPREARFIQTVLADGYTDFGEPPEDYRDLPWPDWLQHLPTEDLLVPVNRLLSRTNPSVPTVDVPSFIWEGVRDLPSLIFDKGNSLLALPGNQNLRWQFGWKPLLSDLGRMMVFGEVASKKLAQIERLIRGKLKTKSAIQKASAHAIHHYEFDMRDTPFEFETDPPVFQVEKSTYLDQWGSVTYRLQDSARAEFERYSVDAKRWKAIRAAYGLHLNNPSSLWEVLPWSWMFDWFLPIQDTLDRYSNFIPTEISNLCVMTKTTTVFAFGATTHPDLRVDVPLTITRETQERKILAPDGTLPNIHASIPILDARKLGLLASILAQRVKT